MLVSDNSHAHIANQTEACRVRRVANDPAAVVQVFDRDIAGIQVRDHGVVERGCLKYGRVIDRADDGHTGASARGLVQRRHHKKCPADLDNRKNQDEQDRGDQSEFDRG